MAAVDPAFKSLPKNSTLFATWRVDKTQLVLVPKEQYGYFYTGDSYIVAAVSDSTERAHSFMKGKRATGPLEIHIHFWLGTQTSQEEAGVAAYKTVELDNFLGATSVQHREVQGFESRRFISYFSRGIRVQSGKADGVYTAADDVYPPRMYHIKGKRKPIVQELPSVSWTHMNDGDVFVIYLYHIIFVWNGKFSNYVEKIQGAIAAQQLKAENGEGTIIIVDEGTEKQLGSPEKEYFAHVLPFDERYVKSHRDVLQNQGFERNPHFEIKLYRCSDENGTLRVTEVKTGPLDQQDLVSQDSFIVDNAEAGIWVWVGKKASQKERVEAMRNAQGFIKKKGYPHCTQVTRVVEGGEPTEFKCLFHNWHKAESSVPAAISSAKSRAQVAPGKTIQTKFDAATLHSNPNLAAQMQLVDDGKGKKELFRVHNADLHPVDPKEQGKFYSKDCYVVVYIYETDGKEHCLIYYWLGEESSLEDQAAAGVKAIELDDRLHGQAVQIRLIQGQETPHFMTIFAGKMIVLGGNKLRGIRNGRFTSQPEDCYLLRVHGTNERNTKAVQVPCSAASLNSGDVFLLFGPSTVHLWAGRGSTGDEREMAKKVATDSGKEMILVTEGQEKDDFWTAIGGKLNINTTKYMQMEEHPRAVRLFQCLSRSGRLCVDEIVSFDQSDLMEDDIMLLDAWTTLFLWIGSKASREDRKNSFKYAEEYLKSDASAREPTLPLVWIKQGLEPPIFTGFFDIWDEQYWQKLPTYEGIKNEIWQSNQNLIAIQQEAAKMRNVRAEVEKYPLAALQVKNPEELPPYVDPANKEVYLADADFERLFKMPYESFDKLPGWKKLEMKKKVGLF
ncbi:advillin-like [Ornithodoros turicata]|uniref:advillin-like n=1 Tax=Ornithodoros turicata TaxID=34597 RepID=UPI003139188D